MPTIDDLSKQLNEIKKLIAKRDADLKVAPSKGENFSFWADSIVKYGAIFAAVAVAGYSAIGAVNLFDRSEEMIKTAQAEIAAITGTAMPRSAHVEGLDGLIDDTIVFSVWFGPKIIEGMRVYRVELNGTVAFKVEGGTATLIGFNSMALGQLLNIVSINSDGEIMPENKRRNGTMAFSTASVQDGNKFSDISSGAITETYRLNFSDCEKAEQYAKSLYSMKTNSYYGTFRIQPVFERMVDTPKYGEFKVKFEKDDIYSCDFIKGNSPKF